MRAIALFLHGAPREILDRPDEQRLATLVRAIDECLWRQEFRFIDDEEATPEARRAIGELSRDDLWWVRLFALHMMIREPELFDLATFERLADDEQEIIRKEAATIQAEIQEKSPAIPENLRPLGKDEDDDEVLDVGE